MENVLALEQLSPDAAVRKTASMQDSLADRSRLHDVIVYGEQEPAGNAESQDNPDHVLLETPHGEIRFTSPIINAAGPRHEGISNFDDLGQSESGAIVLKTATLVGTSGNPEPRYSPPGEFHEGALNAMGLPNLGYEVYAEEVPRLKETYRKPVFASISGKKPGDNATMIRRFTEKGVDAIEINGSCQNIHRNGPMLANDPVALARELHECREATDKPLGVKLPAYADAHYFEAIAAVLLEGEVDFITAINTVGPSLKVDYQVARTAMAAMSGYGGLSGEPIRPIAIANVHKLYELIGETIPIIGVGGISQGWHALEHFEAGASVAALATAFMEEGARVFERIWRELLTEIDGRSVEEIRGSLAVHPEEAVPAS